MPKLERYNQQTRTAGTPLDSGVERVGAAVHQVSGALAQAGATIDQVNARKEDLWADAVLA
jgi:hypothetical protein